MRRLGFFLFSFAAILYAEGDPFPFESIAVQTKDLGQTITSQPTVKKEKRFAFLYKNAIRRGHVQDPELSWDWGRRTGVGWNTVIKNWNLMATFTRFYTKSFASITTQDGRALPIWQPTRAKETELPWRLHVNVGDLEVGKNLTVRDNFFLRPHAGCRAVWLHQKHRTIKSNPKEIGPIFCASQCAGIGFRGGVDSLWRVKEAFSFFGDSAFSLLSSYATSRYQIVTTQEEMNRAAKIAMAEFSLGMQYEKLFSSFNKMTFRMGYEMHYLFNQTRWMNWFGGGQDILSQEPSGISLQGLTLGLRLDF
jgi:hypothetical protein